MIRNRVIALTGIMLATAIVLVACIQVATGLDAVTTREPIEPSRVVLGPLFVATSTPVFSTENTAAVPGDWDSSFVEPTSTVDPNLCSITQSGSQYNYNLSCSVPGVTCNEICMNSVGTGTTSECNKLVIKFKVSNFSGSMAGPAVDYVTVAIFGYAGSDPPPADPSSASWLPGLVVLRDGSLCIDAISNCSGARKTTEQITAGDWYTATYDLWIDQDGPGFAKLYMNGTPTPWADTTGDYWQYGTDIDSLYTGMNWIGYYGEDGDTVSIDFVEWTVEDVTVCEAEYGTATSTPTATSAPTNTPTATSTPTATANATETANFYATETAIAQQTPRPAGVYVIEVLSSQGPTNTPRPTRTPTPTATTAP